SGPAVLLVASRLIYPERMVAPPLPSPGSVPLGLAVDRRGSAPWPRGTGGLTGQRAFGERDRDGGEHAAEVRGDGLRAQGLAQFFDGRADALRGLDHGLLVEVPHLQRVPPEQLLDLARREAADLVPDHAADQRAGAFRMRVVRAPAEIVQAD